MFQTKVAEKPKNTLYGQFFSPKIVPFIK